MLQNLLLKTISKRDPSSLPPSPWSAALVFLPQVLISEPAAKLCPLQKDAALLSPSNKNRKANSQAIPSRGHRSQSSLRSNVKFL
jgi:hypothetical protein